MGNAASEGVTPIPYCEVVKGFPKWWLSGAMTPAHVEELCGDIGAAAVRTQAAMGIGWPSHRLQRFMAGQQRLPITQSGGKCQPGVGEW
jgi:hypothetical protein